MSITNHVDRAILELTVAFKNSESNMMLLNLHR